MPPDTTTDRASTAVVLADGVSTRYVRRGAGLTVLLLGGDPAVAEALASSFRVIAPEVTDDAPSQPVARLRGLLDGLGLAEVAILASPALADAALGLAREEPDRVKGTLLLVPSSPSKTDLAQLSRALARLFQ
jgi:pimeloyl-ACP methyl ester carboxylesterase